MRGEWGLFDPGPAGRGEGTAGILEQCAEGGPGGTHSHKRRRRKAAGLPGIWRSRAGGKDERSPRHFTPAPPRATPFTTPIGQEPAHPKRPRPLAKPRA